MLEGYSAKLEAPFAVIGIRTRAERLTELEYLPSGAATLKPIDAFSREVCRQLKAYFKRSEFDFDLPFEWHGTDYQQRVWEAVRAIPRGTVRSYLEVAQTIGSAPRPVGTACGANRVPLGKPLEIKRWLLRHEGAIQ
jgi:methylated-DNA-[protein]-cysteine S-methyltransferase